MSCGPTIGVCTPGPQGPQGPTGPTGPGAGGSGGANVSIIGNVAGAPSLISSGTVYLAGGNNVTLSQNGQSITVSGGNFAGIGTTTATQAGSTLGATLSTNGLSLAIPQWITTASGGIAASLGGNTAGVLAAISTGTLILAGGNNVTLSQNGNSVTISANTVAAATLSVSAGSTSGAFGGVTFPNSNGVTFGLNNGTITASINSTSGAGLGTTFGGTNVSGSMTLNTAGLALSLSGPAESGIGLSAAGSSQSAGTLVLSNSNGVSFGMNGSTVTASYNSTQFAGTGTTFSGTNISGSMTLNSGGLNLALSGAAGGSGASTVGIYAAGNTTAQSSSSTGAQSSINLSFAGVVSGGWSSNTFVISAPGTTGLTQLSAGMSTGGNTVGTTGLASAQLVLAGGNNITLSGSTNAGSMTITISGGAGGGAAQSIGVSTGGNTSGNTGTYSGQVVFAGGNNITLSVSSGAAGAQTITISGANAGGAQTGISGIIVSNTTYTSGTVSFSNANGISFGSSAGQAITASYTVPAVATTAAYYFQGNTTGQSSSSTAGDQTLSISAGGALSGGWSGGSILLSAPATSSISGTGIVSISVNGSTISIGAPSYASTLSRLDVWPEGDISSTGLTQGSASIVYMQVLQPVSFTRVDVPILVSISSSATAATAALNISSGLVIYSRNGSTLSPIAGALGTTTHTFASNSANWSNLTGGKDVSFPIATSLVPGEYWVGFQISTTNNSSVGTATTQLANTFSVIFGSIITNSQFGDFGTIYGASHNLSSQGVFSNTITATNQTLAMSQITATGASAQLGNFPVIFKNY